MYFALLIFIIHSNTNVVYHCNQKQSDFDYWRKFLRCSIKPKQIVKCIFLTNAYQY